ncbi:hypothetical protein DL770_005010 [Monosporascus sp. CRB-9-2]|nr:hypothetical protein DL770_005010 [Monosporascus sp. CRB-9-2]
MYSDLSAHPMSCDTAPGVMGHSSYTTPLAVPPALDRTMSDDEAKETRLVLASPEKPTRGKYTTNQGFDSLGHGNAKEEYDELLGEYEEKRKVLRKISRHLHQ